MKPGDRVRIRGGGRGQAVIGTVLSSSTVEALPSIPGAPVLEAVQHLLRELLVDEVAMIGYDFVLHDGTRQPVSFAALHNERGWHDLRGQTLEIEAGASG